MISTIDYVLILAVGVSTGDYKRRPIGTNGEHALISVSLGSSIFQREATVTGRVRAREGKQRERGRDNETRGRFSNSDAYFAEAEIATKRLHKGCAEASRGNLILLERR